MDVRKADPQSAALIASQLPAAAQVARQIAHDGVAILSGVVSADWLKQARAYVEETLPHSGTDEILFHQFADPAGTFAHDFVAQPEVRAFMTSVASASFPALRRPDEHTLENELRLVFGDDDPAGPLWFHYDGTVTTMVVPIIIPVGEPSRSGELVLIPNRRRYRRFVLVNIVEKLYTQNEAYRRRFVRRLASAHPKVVSLKPGNVYLFDGYRSYHASMPCPTGTRRATLLLHLGDVHHDSAVLINAKRVYRRARAQIAL